MTEEKKLYDFYCLLVDEGNHFSQEKMTPDEAEKYAKELYLRYEEVKE